MVTRLLYYQAEIYLILHKLCHIDWYKAYGGNLPTILSNRKIFDTAQTMSYRFGTKLTVVTCLLYYQTGRYLIQHKLCHIDWYKAYGGNMPTILSNRKIFDTAQTMSYRLVQSLRW